jgi:hypothetical protein
VSALGPPSTIVKIGTGMETEAMRKGEVRRCEQAGKGRAECEEMVR